jgi:hypothetical protein
MNCATPFLAFLILSAETFATVPAQVQVSIDSVIGGRGTYVPDEGVYKVVLPREAATIVQDYQRLSPNLGLNSWAAFASAVHQEAVLTGQLLLLEDEVNPVVTVALRGRLEVTGLSQLRAFDGPRVQVLDVTGVGTFSELASDFRKCLDEVQQVRRTATLHDKSLDLPTPPMENAIDPEPLDSALSMRGTSVDGVYTAVIGRRALVHGETIGREMGISTWFSFAGKSDRAIVHGEFVESSDGLKKLLTALRAKDFEIISVRNHLAGEHPPLLFVHFRAEGSSVRLAKDLRYVLDVQVGRLH